MPRSPDRLRVAIVAGESSGDLLGAGLLKELKQSNKHLSAVGIGGPLMEAEGLLSWYSMGQLSVMGYAEVLVKLPQLLWLRYRLRKQIEAYNPDVFIGIDAPDFNIGLERKLRTKSIPVIHYVSPSIWAWRYERVNKIRESVDQMLVLFPFEKSIYDLEKIAAIHVGHPLAKMNTKDLDKSAARDILGTSQEGRLIALLPGSRRLEIKRHAGLMLAVANRLASTFSDIRFVIPAVDESAKEEINNLALRTYPPLAQRLICVLGNASTVFRASDLALVASGTATLEGAMSGCPMVVTYRVSVITAWLMRRKAHAKFVALPNIIANKLVIPEFIQEDADPEIIAKSMIELLTDVRKIEFMRSEFEIIKSSLTVESDAPTGDAIMRFLSERKV